MKLNIEKEAKTEAEMEIKAVREEAARLEVCNMDADKELKKAKEKLEKTDMELSSATAGTQHSSGTL